MQNLGAINRLRARRPYWLLLALALFFAGQIAITAHWHDVATSSHTTLDADCALCVLSSTAGAAVVSDALVVAGIILCAFLLTEIARAFISQRVRPYQSRAPPFYS